MGPGPKAAHGRWVAGAWLAILALYVAVRLPLLDVPLERDEGAFALMGRAILAGAVPYRDVFDHKPPGVYYLYAAVLPLIPASARGVHAFLLVWNLATLFCIASLARALAGAAAGRWAAFVFVIVGSAVSVQGFSTTTEMLLLLPMTASLRLTIAGLTPAPRWPILAVAGALAAGACLIKQPAALPLLAAPLWITVTERHQPGRAAAALSVWLAGGVGLTTAVLASFAAAGAAEPLWFWTVTYNRLYGEQAGAMDWLAILGGRLPDVGWDLGAPLALALLGTIAGMARRQRHVWFGAVFLLLSFAAVCHSPFFYAHYFALATPALAVAAGTGIAWLCAVAQPEARPGARAAVRRRAARRRAIATTSGPRWPAVAVGAAGIAAVLLPPAIARPWYWVMPDPVDVAWNQWGAQAFDASPLIGTYLREHTRPDESIFIYGSEPQVLYFAERRSASPFVTAYPLTAPWPPQRELQERAWAAIAAARPRYVLVSANPASLLRNEEMDHFLEDRLRDLVLADYVREGFLCVERSQAQISPQPIAGTTISMEIWRRRNP